MNLDEFFQQIGTARWRAAQIYRRARKSFVQHQELLLEGFEELHAALEDLQVAHEELRQQNEELAAAHEVVQVERQRYRDLFEFVPDPYLVSDGKGIIREANPAAATLLNVPSQFLVGKPLAIFVSKEERRAFLTKLTRLHFSQHQGQEWEERLQPRNGKPFEAIVKVATVHHRYDRPIALSWLLRDITERKQAESALGLLRDVVQQANESIFITSAELDEPGPRIVFVNPAFTKMTGYTCEEIIGKTPRILQGPKTDRSALDRLHRNLSQGQLFYAEMINYRKDGTEYKVELSCAPIRNERGEITHFVSIQRDITQGKQALETLPQ